MTGREREGEGDKERERRRGSRGMWREEGRKRGRKEKRGRNGVRGERGGERERRKGLIKEKDRESLKRVKQQSQNRKRRGGRFLMKRSVK